MKINKIAVLYIVLIILSTSFTSGALTDGLKMYHMFTTSSALDSTANNNDGTSITAIHETNSSCFYGGCFDYTYVNGVSNQEIVIPSDASINALTTFSLSCWLNMGEPVSTVSDLSYFSDTTDGLNPFIAVSSDTALPEGRLKYYQSANRYSTTIMNYGVWNHVVMTRTGTTLKFYINGVYTDTFTSSSSAFGNGYWFGGYSGSTSQYGYDGLMDECGLWDKVLSDGSPSINATAGEEIAQLYGGGTPPEYPFVQGTLVLDTPVINNQNSTLVIFPFEFNGTVVDTTDIWNVTFYVNEILEDTLINIVLNDTNLIFNFTNGKGYYNMTVNASNNDSIVGSITRTDIFIDSTQPGINIISDFTNNSLWQRGSDLLNLTTLLNDTHLEAGNWSIFLVDSSFIRQSLHNNTFVQDIVTEQYQFNFTDDLSTFTIGEMYEYNIQAWDGHTNNDLRYSPTKVINTIRYGGLSFYCDKTQTIDWEETHDSIKPIITFTTPAKKQTCYYETTGQWKKVKRVDDKLSMWYIDLSNRFWIDAKHEQIDVDLLTPQKLKIVYTFNSPTDYLKTETFGDLNFNEQSYFFLVDTYTSYLANKINISTATISGSAWQLVSNSSFNVTGFRNFFTKFSTQSVKTGSGGSNDLFINLTIDGLQIKTQKIRSMSSTDVGVSGFFANFSVSLGSHNIELFLREEGPLDVSISNTDFSILEFETQNGEEVCTPVIESKTTSLTSTSNTVIDRFNLSNTYPSGSIVQQQYVVNASATDYISLFLHHNNSGINSTIVERYISGVGVTGSMFNSFLTTTMHQNNNYTLFGKTTNGNTVNIELDLFSFCTETINSTKINTVTGTNESTDGTNNITLTAGTHRLISLPITLRNSTSVFVEASFTVGSLSGIQKPLFNVTTDNGKCNIIKERTIANNDDIANIFITCVANSFSVGDIKIFTADVTVETGETLIVFDESLLLFEVERFDIATINLPPVITLDEDIPIIIEGNDATLTIGGTDLNEDNINLQVLWFVNGVVKEKQNATITTGGNIEFTFSSGNYVQGQFVNATITGNDTFLDSNTLQTSTRLVESSLSITDLILINISADTQSLESEVKLTGYTLGFLIFFIVLFIGAIHYKFYILWTFAGVVELVMGLLIANNQDGLSKVLILAFTIAIGIGLMLGGIAMHLGVSITEKDRDKNKNSIYNKL